MNQINNFLILGLMLGVFACGGGSSSGDSTTNSLSSLSDGVSITKVVCSGASSNGYLGGGDISTTSTSLIGYGVGFADTVANCVFTLVSVKSHAPRAYDVIIVSAEPTLLANGHTWPLATYPLCIGTTNLSANASCLSTNEVHADANGNATVSIAMDASHLWNGIANFMSSLELSEVGSSYKGTNQYFAGVTPSVQTVQLITNTGTLQAQTAGSYMNALPPAGWTCTYLGNNVSINLNGPPTGTQFCQSP